MITFASPFLAAAVATMAIARQSAAQSTLEAEIETRRRELGVPGAAVTVMMGDSTLLEKGFGYRDISSRLPVTARTRFLIGSCTKPFTALAAMIAVDRGAVSLQDSPAKHLPYFQLLDSAADRQANLTDLLSHRTGVPDALNGGWYERYGTTGRLIRAAMRTPATGEFRRSFHYNNYLFMAAGEAVAVALGQPYVDVITERIFKPLGMHESGLSLTDMATSSDFSYGYEDSGRTRVSPTRLVWNATIAPAANIHSTAHDMGLWLRMLLRRGAVDDVRLVSDSAFGLMLAPAVRTSGGHYALGWFVETWHGMRLYSHPGGVMGYGSRCEFLPEKSIGWAVLTNVDDQSFPKAVREAVYDHLIAPRR